MELTNFTRDFLINTNSYIAYHFI